MDAMGILSVSWVGNWSRWYGGCCRVGFGVVKSEISGVSTREKARDPFSAQHIPYPVGTFESMIFRTSPGEICTIVPWRAYTSFFFPVQISQKTLYLKALKGDFF